MDAGLRRHDEATRPESRCQRRLALWETRLPDQHRQPAHALDVLGDVLDAGF
jgi:hypothetical protein